MVDARLAGGWLGAMRFDNLSDAAWRVFTGALMWSNENGTDGRIPVRYLKYLHPDGEQPEAFKQMVAAGIWSKQGDEYALTSWESDLGQSTALEVQTYKANAAKRAKDYRARVQSRLAKQVEFEPASSLTVTRDVTRDVRPHVGKGKGKGSGYTNTLESGVSEEVEATNPTTGETELVWLTRPPGISDEAWKLMKEAA